MNQDVKLMDVDERTNALRKCLLADFLTPDFLKFVGLLFS
jgi:hypothetical protein